MNKYIDNEIILQRKVEPFIYVYIMIIIIIMLSLIIIFTVFNYKTYYDLRGIIINEENEYYLKIYIPISKVKYLVNNNKLVIDGKLYRYKIINIDSEYFTDNVDTYQIIKIKVNLPIKYKLNNLVINLKVVKEDKKIIEYILNK